MRLELSRVNKGLALIVMLSGFYILLFPFLPLLSYNAQRVTKAEHVKREKFKLSQPVVDSDMPNDNRIRIPKLFIDEKINQGSSINVINEGGTWLRPKTSTPIAQGNSVIVGHRFTYEGPAPFYNLDKLVSGDSFAVFWEGQRRVYEVSRVYVTSPQDRTVESSSEESELTLYTCTPLWSAKDRLIVKAKLVK